VTRRMRFFRLVALAAVLAALPGMPRAATDMSNLTIAELTAIEMVSGYLNDIRTMQGNFVQTAPDGEVTHGRFFIERPGKMRFDYALPSHLTVISDGFWVAVQDRQLKTTERYPLRTTPLRMLLSRDLDLMEDAQVLGVDPDANNEISITLQERSGRAEGTLTLFFDPIENRLDRWIVSDAQGLDTNVVLKDVVRGEPIDPSRFRIVEDTSIDVRQ
jgi:outer membrane lipoprotein-sorting protein